MVRTATPGPPGDLAGFPRTFGLIPPEESGLTGLGGLIPPFFSRSKSPPSAPVFALGCLFAQKIPRPRTPGFLFPGSLCGGERNPPGFLRRHPRSTGGGKSVHSRQSRPRRRPGPPRGLGDKKGYSEGPKPKVVPRQKHPSRSGADKNPRVGGGKWGGKGESKTPWGKSRGFPPLKRWGQQGPWGRWV